MVICGVIVVCFISSFFVSHFFVCFVLSACSIQTSYDVYLVHWLWLKTCLFCSLVCFLLLLLKLIKMFSLSPLTFHYLKNTCPQSFFQIEDVLFALNSNNTVFIILCNASCSFLFSIKLWSYILFETICVHYVFAWLLAMWFSFCSYVTSIFDALQFKQKHICWSLLSLSSK